jgi:penicillin amidase
MSRTAKVILVFIIIVLALAIGLLVGGYLTARQQFPTTSGTLAAPGLQQPVEVYRDSWGIPHLYAANEHDLFFAQGFIHAQDRFWQMEFWRRIGAGRLSEILGPSALEDDRFIRTLGWHRVAAQELEALSGEDRDALQAYADGVNTYVSANRGKLGLEFVLLGLTGVSFEPEPWTPLNTLTWGKVMAWDLGGNRSDELLRAHLAAALGDSAVRVFYPDYPADYPVIVSQTLNPASLAAVPDQILHPLAFGQGSGIGSNSWVVAGSRTDTGMPYLANDPHLGIQMPSIWYEIGLHCTEPGPACRYDLVGASFAGAPGVIIGHNARIAWGETNLGPDVQDLFIERLNPDNPMQYEYQGAWQDMELITEEIAVAGEDKPVTLLVRQTRHGPIINDVLGGPEDDWYYGWQPLALSWTALQPGTLIPSMLRLDRAGNWEEFREALRYWDIASQNFVYADVDGNIGYQASGRIPQRAAGDGTMPVPGWTGEHEWTGFIPFDSLPTSFNPEKGYISTANNAVVGESYPYLLTKDWDPGYRALRLDEALANDGSLTRDEIQLLQGDSLSTWTRQVLPYVLALNPEDPILFQAIGQLRAWDGNATRDSSPAALFEVFRLHLAQRTFEDEMGEKLFEKAIGQSMVALLNLLEDPSSAWFDDRRTPEVEDREMILLLALADAVDELMESQGEDMTGWRWGDLHRATFENQSLGQSGIAPIERIFNRGPVEVDGLGDTLNATSYDLAEPFDVNWVPSYRQIIDLADFARSVSVHTTGQSGHPFHPHYDDMIDLWRNIQLHPMLWARSDVEASAADHLTLTP